MGADEYLATDWLQTVKACAAASQLPRQKDNESLQTVCFLLCFLQSLIVVVCSRPASGSPSVGFVRPDLSVETLLSCSSKSCGYTAGDSQPQCVLSQVPIHLLVLVGSRFQSYSNYFFVSLLLLRPLLLPRVLPGS